MTYVTMEEANLYFSIRIDADAWDQASAEKKEKFLNHAERVFTRLSYRGIQETAELIFPRQYDIDYVTPDEFKEAIFEEALSLLNNYRPEKDAANLHVTSSAFAGFQTTVNEKMDRPWIYVGLSSPTAWQLIAPFLKDLRSFRTVAG